MLACSFAQRPVVTSIDNGDVRSRASGHAAARAAFARMRDLVQRRSDLKLGFERALEELVSRYDTRIYENRFVVGGAIEVFIGALFAAADLEVELVGKLDPRIDLALGPQRVGMSVKASLTGRNDDIRLLNVLGSAAAASWEDPTTFVIAGVGIGYADPGLLPGMAVRKADALVLPRAALRRLFADRPEFLLVCRVAAKKGLSGGRLASRDAAMAVLTDTTNPLLSHVDTARPSAARLPVVRTRKTAARFTAPELKQEILDDMAAFTGRPRRSVSTGSTELKDSLIDIVEGLKLPISARLSKPALARAIAEYGGLSWDPTCDSLATRSKGGSTVTKRGLLRVRDAVRTIVDRRLRGSSLRDEVQLRLAADDVAHEDGT